MNRLTTCLSALCVAAAGMASTAHAEALTPWTFQLGVHNVDPKSHNGNGVEVDSATGATFNVRYFLDSSFAVDLLAALPFGHDVSVEGAGEVAKVHHLPPTLSLTWHPLPVAKVKPFVSAGLNYTTFFDIDEKGALSGTKLKLKDSWGPAAQAGVEFALGPHSAIVADLRWMDIDTKASVDGASIGTVHIDPFAYGLSYVYRF